MAVKTPFTDADFSSILSRYPLGDYLRSQPIHTGTVQTNFCLWTTQGKFIFRYYENRSRESVLFECNLIRYLKRRNYPCPAPMRNRQGEMVGIIREKPFVLFAFIEGQHLEDPGEAQQKQLIQKVAELQNLTRGYRPAYTRHRWNYGVPLCRDLAQRAAQSINTRNARAKLAWHAGELDRLDLPASLPKGVCHCDFHFSNILFKNGEFAALIDFDDANYTFLTYDLITLIDPFVDSFRWDTWSQFPVDENILDFSQASGVAAEYMKYRPLSPIEKRHLFDVFKLSILIDCVWYFERGEASDFYEKRKIDALNRLGREGFTRAVFMPGAPDRAANQK